MTLQVNSSCSVAGSPAVISLGEQSSPAFHTSIPDCSDKLSSSIHKVVDYLSLCAGKQSQSEVYD